MLQIMTNYVPPAVNVTEQQLARFGADKLSQIEQISPHIYWGFTTDDIFRDPETNEVMERRTWTEKPRHLDLPPPAKNGAENNIDTVSTWNAIFGNVYLTELLYAESAEEISVPDTGYNFALEKMIMYGVYEFC